MPLVGLAKHRSTSRRLIEVHDILTMEQIIIVSPQTQVCGDKEDGECNVSFGYVKDLN